MINIKRFKQIIFEIYFFFINYLFLKFIQTSIKNDEEELIKLETKTDNLEIEIKVHYNEIKSINNEIKSLNNKIEAINNEIKSLNDKIESLEKTIFQDGVSESNATTRTSNSSDEPHNKR